MTTLALLRSLARAGSVVFLIATPGCHEHVALRAPPRNASFEERASAYAKLRPLSYHETHITYTQYGMPVGSARRTDYLQLAEGQRVYYPEDILPVVDEASPSAVAAGESESARSTANTLHGIAIGGYVVGIGLVFLPILSRDPGEDIDFTPIYVGCGVALASGIVSLVGSGFGRKANDEAATAFETYDSGLQRRINVCPRDGKLQPCE